MEEILELLAALFAALKKRRAGPPPRGRGKSQTLGERGPSRTLPGRARPPAPLGRALRDALTERAGRLVAAPLPSANSPAASTASAPAGATSRAVGVSQPAVAGGFAPGAAAMSPRPASPRLATTGWSDGAALLPRSQRSDASAAEGNLVTALFATPQSLVAAFVVAEVLAKPVALRES